MERNLKLVIILINSVKIVDDREGILVLSRDYNNVSNKKHVNLMEVVTMMDNEKLALEVLRLKRLRAERDLLDEKINSIESQVKEEMSSRNEYEISGEGWKVSWKTVSSRRFDQSSFKEDNPELYEKYKKLTESRRFTVS